MRAARLIASGAGCGYAPWAPGTVGSLAAALLGAGLLAWSHWALLAAALLAAGGGIWAIRACGAAADDPGWVVIDEVVGQWITLLGLAAATPMGVVAAFLLFRLLDIAKPGPVGWADRRSGALAVMGDDVVAGLLGAVLLLALQRVWPGLLA